MFEWKLRTLGLFSLEKGKLKGMTGYREDRVRPFLKSAWWKQEKKSQLDLGRKLFMVRAAEHGPGGLERLWNQHFGAVQNPLSPAKLSNLT